MRREGRKEGMRREGRKEGEEWEVKMQRRNGKLKCREDRDTARGCNHFIQQTQ